MEKELQKKSLDRFLRKDYQKLVGYIRRNLEDRFLEASPEDIVQDVALGLIDRLDLDFQIGNVAAYFYRSIKNKIIDYRRKKQRNISLETLGKSKEGNDLLNALPDESPEKNEYMDIDPADLREAISQLRPDEQALILATEYEDRTYEELSEEWEIPLGTLLSRKHRALSKLQKILINNKKQ